MHRTIDVAITVYPDWTIALAIFFSFIAFLCLLYAASEESGTAIIIALACAVIAWVPFGTQYHKGIDKKDEVQVSYNLKTVWVPAVKMENGEWYPKNNQSQEGYDAESVPD